jgi:hypothetical protein
MVKLKMRYDLPTMVASSCWFSSVLKNLSVGGVAVMIVDFDGAHFDNESCSQSEHGGGRVIALSLAGIRELGQHC